MGDSQPVNHPVRNGNKIYQEQIYRYDEVMRYRKMSPFPLTGDEAKYVLSGETKPKSITEAVRNALRIEIPIMSSAEDLLQSIFTGVDQMKFEYESIFQNTDGYIAPIRKASHSFDTYPDCQFNLVNRGAAERFWQCRFCGAQVQIKRSH